MTTEVDTLVDRYLKARTSLDVETEAAIRTVLERLGAPADIAAEAATASASSRSPPGPAVRGWRSSRWSCW